MAHRIPDTRSKKFALRKVEKWQVGSSTACPAIADWAYFYRRFRERNSKPVAWSGTYSTRLQATPDPVAAEFATPGIAKVD
jgi:hypothetical protein